MTTPILRAPGTPANRKPPPQMPPAAASRLRGQERTGPDNLGLGRGSPLLPWRAILGVMRTGPRLSSLEGTQESGEQPVWVATRHTACV
jgi:hypothetical protein